MRSLRLIFTFLAALAFFGMASRSALALSGSEFQAGRIIDDGIFFSGNGLATNQVQAFLNPKVPSCNTWHAKSSNPNDSGPPYTCLKDFRQDTWNIPGDAYCNGFSQGNKTAAQIIYEVGQSCGVSQKVILVTLQKEQSLITDDWPWNIQYEKATGYGCPDNPPVEWPTGCDPNFAGFFRQVYYGARQFKRYAQDTRTFTSYRPYRNNYIQYSPDDTTLDGDPACGGTNVYIQNQATSGLYIYTPYQPNASALANLYGSGDSCGAYGNRNFWRMFTDWFGTTYSGAYHARIIEHSAYPSIKPGQTAPVYVKFQNAGNSAWHDDIGAAGTIHKPVRLGTDLPMNHYSPLGDSWIYANRPGVNFARVYASNGTSLTPNQHIAYPGEVVEFWFAYTAPYSLSGGDYLEGFRPIVEGSGPMNDTGSFIVVNVKPAIYTAAYVKQSAYPTIVQGERASTFISYKNTGNTEWYDETSAAGTGKPRVHLATDYPLNRTSVFSSRWPYPHRAGVNFGAVYEANDVTPASNQNVVQPGQIARFNFKMKALPQLSPGFYAEALRPVVQGIGPMNDTGTWMGITVNQANYTADYAGQSAYSTIARGQSADVYMRYKNTGNIAWYDNISAPIEGTLPVRLATDQPLNRNSSFAATWPFLHRPSVSFSAVYEADGTTPATNQNKVLPGQIVRLNFKFTVPSNHPTGFYAEGVRPIVEGHGPMNDVGSWLGLTVVP